MNDLITGIQSLFVLMNEFMFSILAVSFGLLIILVFKQFHLRTRIVRRLHIDGHNLIVKLALSKKESGQYMSYGELESEVYSFTDKYDESIKVFIGSFTALGMIFTFIGLTFAVGKISDIIKNMEGSDFNNIVEGLSPVIGGMAIAFYSSLIGLILSLLFSLINNHLKVRVDRKVDAFILNAKHEVLPEYAPVTSQAQVQKAFHIQQEQMKEFLTNHMVHTESVLTNLSGDLHDSMKELQDKNTSVFSDFSDNVHNSMNEINTLYKDSFSIFSNVIEKLNSNVDTANANIVSGAETMKLIETEIGKSLLSLSSNVDQFTKKVTSISKFSAPIEQSAEKFESFTEEMLNSMDQFTSMLSGSTLKDDFRSIHVKLDAFDSLAGNLQHVTKENSDNTELIKNSLNSQGSEISKIQTSAQSNKEAVEIALQQQADSISSIQKEAGANKATIESVLNKQGEVIAKIQTDTVSSAKTLEKEINQQSNNIAQIKADIKNNSDIVSKSETSLKDIDQKVTDIESNSSDIKTKIENVNDRVGVMEGKINALQRLSKPLSKPKYSGILRSALPKQKSANSNTENTLAKPKERMDKTKVNEQEEKPISRWFGLGKIFKK